jgi:hypothetical protein
MCPFRWISPPTCQHTRRGYLLAAFLAGASVRFRFAGAGVAGSVFVVGVVVVGVIAMAGCRCRCVVFGWVGWLSNAGTPW